MPRSDGKYLSLIKFILMMVGSLLIAGCGPVKELYPDQYKKNLIIDFETDIIKADHSRFEVVAGINDLNNQCDTDYRGMVELKKGKNMLGLKQGQETYIAIEILQKQSFHSPVSSIMRGTMIKPGKGIKYHLVVKYVDEMFDFRLFKIKNKKRYEQKITPLTVRGKNCRSS